MTKNIYLSESKKYCHAPNIIVNFKNKFDKNYSLNKSISVIPSVSVFHIDLNASFNLPKPTKCVTYIFPAIGNIVQVMFYIKLPKLL